MKIVLEEHSVREVVENYVDNDESGVVGYGGLLNIRPAYQREFVYDSKRQEAVINTIINGFPLNTMYWTLGDDAHFELLDGQQRTVSFCRFVNNRFAVRHKGDMCFFSNLTPEEQSRVLDYKLTIYVCTGDTREKLDWFKVVNIAGMKLTDQELRNVVYTGAWLSDAKRHFSKTMCAAYQLANKYMTGSTIRQEYLETVLMWIADYDGLAGRTDADKIETYMGLHQHDNDCKVLWDYFQKVIAWVNATFPVYYREMKNVDWGLLYNHYCNDKLDPDDIKSRIAELMEDEDVTKKSGIFGYVLDGDERRLSLRDFPDKIKREVYTRQKGVCVKCGKHFDIEDMDADHVTPWSKGGRTTADNCQLLCADCNRRKSNT